jgi:enoyl-CoA hydratase/carnithine racemase
MAIGSQLKLGDPPMSIQVEERPCQAGSIGLITLNSPKTLNALSGEMIDR